MTMLIAYTWNDKIVMMADSRSSAKDSEGKMVDFNDKATKIFPFNKRMVIGHSGLRKISVGGGQYVDLMQIIEHYLKIHQQILPTISGEEALKGLIKMWNGILSEKFGRQPTSVDAMYTLLLCKWEEVEPGRVLPKVYSYQSQFGDIHTSKGAVAGDEEVYPIIIPYFESNIENMTFTASVEHFKKGFLEVIDKVDTVGGFIHVYVLESDSFKSHWLDHEFF
ncbi:hypothetical protein [Peribacillus deserti]|uniref:Uncharacterized protein n=1 Tax=Peribacillus deserti TaxID=673318 RepID=A0A2N5M831_9BACI|nr:hypothetical protein [Peribacillus deserti]PLT30507.1 hypothetical protein CUU66_07560 [Peribacillus deserti]